MTQEQQYGLQARVSVNNNGRVTIPAQLRRAAGLEPGVDLVAFVEDGRVVLESREHLKQRLHEMAATWEPVTGSAADDLIAERRADAAREASGTESEA